MVWFVTLVDVMQRWVTQSLITPSELSTLVSVLFKYIMINVV